MPRWFCVLCVSAVCKENDLRYQTNLVDIQCMAVAHCAMPVRLKVKVMQLSDALPVWVCSSMWLHMFLDDLIQFFDIVRCSRHLVCETTCFSYQWKLAYSTMWASLCWKHCSVLISLIPESNYGTQGRFNEKWK